LFSRASKITSSEAVPKRLSTWSDSILKFNTQYQRGYGTLPTMQGKGYIDVHQSLIVPELNLIGSRIIPYVLPTVYSDYNGQTQMYLYYRPYRKTFGSGHTITKNWFCTKIVMLTWICCWSIANWSMLVTWQGCVCSFTVVHWLMYILILI
jgi:hypothetical protein